MCSHSYRNRTVVGYTYRYSFNLGYFYGISSPVNAMCLVRPVVWIHMTIRPDFFTWGKLGSLAYSDVITQNAVLSYVTIAFNAAT